MNAMKRVACLLLALTVAACAAPSTPVPPTAVLVPTTLVATTSLPPTPTSAPPMATAALPTATVLPPAATALPPTVASLPSPTPTPKPLMGWSLAGVFPESNVDMTAFQIPDGRYVMYYITNVAENQGRGGSSARALSKDGVNWQVEKDWRCPAELCPNQQLGMTSVLKLPDGRFRMYLSQTQAQGPERSVFSAVSADGLNWTREPGVRLSMDRSEFETGPMTMANHSPILLPDGRIRLFYNGQKGPGGQIVFLSAVSSDGLNFTRDAGHRVDQVEWKQVSPQARVNSVEDPHLMSVAGGYRMYYFGIPWMIRTAFSNDGLNFKDEGTTPAPGADAFALQLNDRLLLYSNLQRYAGENVCPGAPCFSNYELVYILAYQQLPFTLGVESVDAGKRQATLTVEGTSKEPVTLSPLVSGFLQGCPSPDVADAGLPASCRFDPAMYTITPSRGTPPFKATISWQRLNNPPGWVEVTGTDGTTTAIAKVDCMQPNPDVLLCPSSQPPLVSGGPAGSASPPGQGSNSGMPAALADALKQYKDATLEGVLKGTVAAPGGFDQCLTAGYDTVKLMPGFLSDLRSAKVLPSPLNKALAAYCLQQLNVLGDIGK